MNTDLRNLRRKHEDANPRLSKLAASPPFFREHGVHGFRVLALGEPRNDGGRERAVGTSLGRLASKRKHGSPPPPPFRGAKGEPRPHEHGLEKSAPEARGRKSPLVEAGRVPAPANMAFMGSGFSPSASPGMTGGSFANAA